MHPRFQSLRLVRPFRRRTGSALELVPVVVACVRASYGAIVRVLHALRFRVDGWIYSALPQRAKNSGRRLLLTRGSRVLASVS